MQIAPHPNVVARVQASIPWAPPPGTRWASVPCPTQTQMTSVDSSGEVVGSPTATTSSPASSVVVVNVPGVGMIGFYLTAPGWIIASSGEACVAQFTAIPMRGAIAKLPPVVVHPQPHGLVKRAQLGAGLSDTSVENMGVAGITVTSAIGGATWGVLIGAFVAAVGSKRYGHDIGVGAAWGAGIGAVIGLGAGLAVKSAAASSSSTGT